MTAPATAAASMTIGLSPAAIVADGASTTVATATVTKSDGGASAGDVVVFSSSSAQDVGPTTNHRDGTYTAAITSTTAAGPSTIVAHDLSRGLFARATLTQLPGPAARVTVQLTPHAIVADGTSTSVATASITDTFANPVPGALLVLSSSDAGVRFSAVTDHGDGTYSAIVTSSRTPGTPFITASVPATGASGRTTLELAGLQSVVSLSAVPSAAATNQAVVLIAIITAPGYGAAPSGTITFESGGVPLPGCTDEVASAQSGQQLSQSTCQTMFAATASPAKIEAVFTSRSPTVADSRANIGIAVGQSGTFTSLDVSNPSVGAGAVSTLIASVAPSNAGPVAPAGWVTFMDNGRAIGGCARQRLVGAGTSATASCAVRYRLTGIHSVTAFYSGDGNFSASGSGAPQRLVVHAVRAQVRGVVEATMRWTFVSTATYTTIRTLTAYQVPQGGTIAVICDGNGCPFSKRASTIGSVKPCRSARTHGCRPQLTVDLRRFFQNRALQVGTRIVVDITRPRWIGKYYRFTIRAGRPPQVRIACLAPGHSKPGSGCS